MTRFLTIISGSDSVGKTTLAINLAYQLKAGGKNPLVLTEDTNWLKDSKLTYSLIIRDLKQMIADRRQLAHSIITGPGEIDACMMRLVRDAGKNIDQGLIDSFCREGINLDDYDYILLDIKGGLSLTALSCCLAPCDSLMVVTPETHSIDDGLKMLESLSTNGFHDPLKLVVTKATDQKTADRAYALLHETAAQNLHIPLEYAGFVNHIDQSPESPDKPFLVEDHDKNKQYFESLISNLEGGSKDLHQNLAPEAFWAQLIDFLSYPMEISSKNSMVGNSSHPYETESVSGNVEIMTYLNDISQQLGNIGDELAQIRKLYEKHVAAVESDTAESKKDCNFLEIIPLDFEAFISDMKDGNPS